MTTEDLMKQVSMVFQDVYLFDDTLEANIRVGDPDASEDRVRWAAELAGVSEIVDRLRTAGKAELAKAAPRCPAVSGSASRWRGRS